MYFIYSIVYIYIYFLYVSNLFDQCIDWSSMCRMVCSRRTLHQRRPLSFNCVAKHKNFISACFVCSGRRERFLAKLMIKKQYWRRACGCN